MKKINQSVSTIIASAFLALTLTACSDVRDVKISQLTTEQEQQVVNKLTNEEKEMVMIYKLNTVFDKQKDDLSYNEMIDFVKQKRKENPQPQK